MVWIIKKEKIFNQLSWKINLEQRKIKSAIKLEWEQDEVEYSSYKDCFIYNSNLVVEIVKLWIPTWSGMYG